MASDAPEGGCGQWRELALEYLPCCRELVEAAKDHINLWYSFLELLSEAGMDESRKAEVESIYKYAWWCVAESGNEWLAAEVETFFYEDLAWFTDFRDQLPRHIEPWQFQRLEPHFHYRYLDDAEFAEFRSHYYDERARMNEHNKRADR